MKKVVNLILIIIMMTGCGGPGDLSPVAYVAYVGEDAAGLKRTVQTHDVVYTIRMVTPEYVTSMEMGDRSYSKQEFANRLQEIKDYIFFYITIAEQPGKGLYDPTEKDMYYMQSAQEDIELVKGNETFKPVAYQYENRYGLSPDNKLLVAFRTADTVGQYQLVFNDRFHRNDLIKASFDFKTLTQLPKLEIK